MSSSEDRKPAAVAADGPEFRSMARPAPANELRVAEGAVIDKNAFMNAPPVAAAAAAPLEPLVPSNWSPTELRTVPAFYPLEKSSRIVEDDPAHAIAARISDCLRQLSIQAVYDNDQATLITAESVEMHLALWKTPLHSPQQGIVVEVQRRSGDSIAFHRYARSILDVAVGLVDYKVDDDIVYSKKVQRLLAMDSKQEEHEHAIQAIEIAHGLLMKDRMDARVLGLESLCLLTDPRKTGLLTSLLTSHVVLLGTTEGVDMPHESKFPDQGPFQEIRETILNLVQFSRISEDDDDSDDEVSEQGDSERMHNLALAVLANALDCIENPDFEHENTKPETLRLRTTSKEITNEFLQNSEDVSKTELLGVLISELGLANSKPHNAVLSAKCIGSLCRASRDAKKRAKELGAKQVVRTALDVGVRTNLRLETECSKVVDVLERVNSEEETNN